MLLTFIKLPIVIKAFVLSIFKWPLKTGLTVHISQASMVKKSVENKNSISRMSQGSWIPVRANKTE